MINLKSNMDRFIGRLLFPLMTLSNYLKSNMDRFIGLNNFSQYPIRQDLKSNMDRFIENTAEYQSMFAKI